jgi:hypothetical protein
MHIPTLGVFSFWMSQTFSILSTHSVTLNLTVFVSIKSFSAWHGLDFVMASVGLLLPLIHFTSAISLLSYDCHRHMRSTISRFSCVVPSLTKQSYKDFESMQRMSRSEIHRIFLIVDLIAAPILNPYTILYSSNAKTLCMTLLHLIDNQWIMLALLSLSTSMITKLICDERS